MRVVVLGLIIPLALAALGAVYMPLTHNTTFHEAATLTFVIFGVYAAGFGLWALLALWFQRGCLLRVAIVLVATITIPPVFGLTGVIGFYLFILFGFPAVGALAAATLINRHDKIATITA